jgi:hypothetical protein
MTLRLTIFSLIMALNIETLKTIMTLSAFNRTTVRIKTIIVTTKVALSVEFVPLC